MNKDFLDGYIYLAEGEKDPRNLLVAFTIARVILIEFDITRHVEVRRDSLSLHSRLTRSIVAIQHHFLLFSNHLSSSTKRSIWHNHRPATRGTQVGLQLTRCNVSHTSSRGCLNATPSFGALAIPLFLEKLLAGSPVTKVRAKI